MSGETEFGTVAKTDVTTYTQVNLEKEVCKREVVPPTRESFLGLAKQIHSVSVLQRRMNQQLTDADVRSIFLFCLIHSKHTAQLFPSK